MNIFRSHPYKTFAMRISAIALAMCWVFYPSFLWFVGSFLAFQFYWVIGLSAGCHRYYAHRSFETSRFWREIMLFAAAAGLSEHPGLYAIVHRAHHRLSDKENDPHHHYAKQWFLSPRAVEIPITKSMKKDLILDPVMKRMLNWYYLYPLITAALLYLVSFEALIYLWAVPVATMTIIRKHITIIGFHKYGYVSYDTDDNSKNSRFLGLMLGGEGLHNNHHAFPRDWNFAKRHDEFDPTSWFVRLIKK